MRRIGRANAFLTGGGPLPEAVGGWMCRCRTAASWFSMAFRPDLPVPVARAAVRHTWASYRGSLDELIRHSGWEAVLHELGVAGVPVTLAEATGDPVPVPGRAAELAAGFPAVRHEVHRGGSHALPLTDGEWCASLITASSQVR